MRVLLLTAAVAVALAAPVQAAGLLKVGDPFPPWSLTDQAGVPVSSAELAGKTYLLWFYPKAMTPGCTKEGCTLRDNFAEFKKADVDVLGISFDVPADNAEFVKQQNFPFRLLSDETKEFSVKVGAADSTSRLWARRISFLVGPDGKILRSYGAVNPTGHAAEVLADLAALKK